jgi:hypothetical protein
MASPRRRLSLGLLAAAAVAAAVVAAVAVTGDDDGDADRAGAAASGTAGPTGVYGAPVTSYAPDPTGLAVATDPPRATSSQGNGTTEPLVLITWSEWDSAAESVAVGGYAAVVESRGTCTLTLTKGSSRASTSVPAEADVSSMSCGAVTVPGSDLSPGTWEAVLTYESDGAAGTSEPVEVEVP